MARGFDQLKQDVKNIFNSITTRVSNAVNAPRGPNKISIAQAVKQTAPTVARDFGRTLSGEGTKIAKIPIIKNIAKMAANTGETVGSGAVDTVRGAYKLVKPNQGLKDRLAGLAEAVYGGAKIVTANPTNPAGKLFQVANLATQIPQSETQRLASGIVRGQTGIDTLADDVKKKESTAKIMDTEFKFDPIETVGRMVGFTRNPINAKIFKTTEKISLIPNAKTAVSKAANFLLTNILRGGGENVLMSVKDIPENATEKEKAKFIRDNFLFGAASELIFRGGTEAGQKALTSVISKFSDSKLASIFDLVKKQVPEPIRDQKISEIEKLARDPKTKLSELTKKVREQVNDFRFQNNIKPETPKMLFREETIPGTSTVKLVRDGRQRPLQNAYGLVAGTEIERDENGRPTGKITYDPVKGVAGLAISDPQIRKVVGDTLKPKTKLLEEASKLDEIGQPLLQESKAVAEAAQEARSIFSDEMIKDVNRLKTMVRSKAGAAGDIETLRKKDSGLVERVVEAVRENPMYESLTDDEALAKAIELPTKAETKVVTPEEIKTAREYRKKAQEVYDSVYNSKTDPRVTEAMIKNERESLDRMAKEDFISWEKSLFEQEGATLTPAQMTRKNLDAIGTIIDRSTVPEYTRDVSQLKDIGAVNRSWRDMFRNIKEVFGDKFASVKRDVLDPFDASKGRFIDALNKHADELDANIVQGLGIDKGTKESGAVQLFGEGKITSEDLIKQFGPEKADKIVQADQWFRGQYDKILDEVNAVRAQVYPNNPEKIIPKRSDYYRHFQEMAEGLAGLKNIFETPSNIESALAGTSEYVKPKSKWLSFAQRRLGDKTTEDAVAGFIDYVKSAEYSKNIDPQIDRFRQLRQELVDQTASVLPDGTPNPNAGKLNNIIESLDDFANDLAGKTNPIDRGLTKLGLSRKALKVLDWFNSRTKANLIVGNLSSTLAQIFNVPQGLADAGPKYAKEGTKTAIMDAFTDNKLTDQSTFLKERYGGSVFDRFDKGILANTKKFARFITSALDEVGSKWIWHANYQKALGEGIENPVKYADDITREMVGGRGIGEVPLAQKSKVIQLAMPFQLEVGNMWHVMKGWADQKDAKKFLYFTVLSFLANRAVANIRGSDVSFDPLNALIEGVQEYQDEPNKAVGIAKGVGRVVGEVFSNVPGGQTVASIYPEKGIKVNGEQLTREELFGEGDPTRFGSVPTVIAGLQDPLFKLVTPYGGQQLKRTLQGAQAVAEGGVKDRSGNLQYAIGGDLPTTLQTLAFGKYSSNNARTYFDEDLSALSEQQTKIWQNAVDQGTDPVKAWTALYRTRLITSFPQKMLAIARDPEMPQDQKRRELVALQKQFTELNQELEKIGKLSTLDIARSEQKPSLDVKASGVSPAQTTKIKIKKPAKPSLKLPKLKISPVKTTSSPTIKVKRSAPTVQSFMQ